MKENLLQKWCDQAWLHCIYLIGIIMGNILLIKWPVWEVPQRLICLLAIMVPLHVFEENTAPGGFFYMNNLGQKSDAPLVYPQNRLTNMFTNLGAEFIFILMTAFAVRIEAASVIAVVIFGIGELIHHTMDGIHMYKRYKDKGKKTLYGPGTITSYICLLPLSVYGCLWLSENPFTASQAILGVAIVLFIIIFLILIPFTFSKRIKSQKYAFSNAGYFSKYE